MTVDDRFSQDFREPKTTAAGHPQRDRHRPGRRLGDRFLPSRAGVVRRPLPDPGRPAAALPDRAHRRFGGGWLPTRYEDVAAIAYDTEHFSSRAIIVSNFRPPRELAPVGGSPPISSDPPFHHDARKLLLPAFTKTAVTKQEPATRRFCHSLIDAFEGQDVVDAAADYAQHIPVRVIADCSASRRRTDRNSVSSSRTCSKASTCLRRSASRGFHACSTTCSRRSTTTSIIRVRTSLPT